jgi:hypothetical protein
MEYWKTGIMEEWAKLRPYERPTNIPSFQFCFSQYSNIPSFQFSKLFKGGKP